MQWRACPRCRNPSKRVGSGDQMKTSWAEHFKRQVEMNYCELILPDYYKLWYSGPTSSKLKISFTDIQKIANTTQGYPAAGAVSTHCASRKRCSTEQIISYLHIHIPSPSTSNNCKTSQNMPLGSPRWGWWRKWLEHQKPWAARIPVEIFSVLKTCTSVFKFSWHWHNMCHVL